MGREQFSNFGFYDAIANTAITAATAGRTVDMRGFESITLTVNAGLYSTGSAGTSDFRLVLQHGTASAAGVDQWSLVPNSQLIHSVWGGYDSTGETGLFGYVTNSYINGSDANIAFVGYKKDTTHRYIRLYVSVTGTNSLVPIAGTFMLGNAGDWPINDNI
jgi:hypothetical protein